jgi:hypothetical protein
MDMLDKETLLVLGENKWEADNMLLKMIHNLKYELFIFGTLTLIFLDSG